MTVVLAPNGERPEVGLQLLAADDLGHSLHPPVEQLVDLGARAEGRVMVEVEVEDHRDPRPQCRDRAVRLVALDD